MLHPELGEMIRDTKPAPTNNKEKIGGTFEDGK